MKLNDVDDSRVLKSKPCPRGCSQGMVLEIDPREVDDPPVARYRCQDCDLEQPVSTETEETYMIPRRLGEWVHAEKILLNRYFRLIDPSDSPDLELLE